MVSMNEMKYEITADRAALRSTMRDLRDEVNLRAQHARETVDPRTYVRRYPWIALGLLVGAGFALGYSGADRKAADGVLEGAKKAGEAISDGAISAKEAVVERFSGEEEPMTAPVEKARSPGIGSRFGEAVHGLLQQGLDEIMEDLRRT